MNTTISNRLVVQRRTDDQAYSKIIYRLKTVIEGDSSYQCITHSDLNDQKAQHLKHESSRGQTHALINCKEPKVPQTQCKTHLTKIGHMTMRYGIKSMKSTNHHRAKNNHKTEATHMIAMNSLNKQPNHLNTTILNQPKIHMKCIAVYQNNS